MESNEFAGGVTFERHLAGFVPTDCGPRNVLIEIIITRVSPSLYSMYTRGVATGSDVYSSATCNNAQTTKLILMSLEDMLVYLGYTVVSKTLCEELEW